MRVLRKGRTLKQASAPGPHRLRGARRGLGLGILMQQQEAAGGGPQSGHEREGKRAS